MQRKDDSLWRSPCFISPHGGWHFFFCWPELLFLVLWLIIDLHIFSVSFILQKKKMEYDLPQITQELHPLSKVLSLPPHILGSSLLIDLSSENPP